MHITSYHSPPTKVFIKCEKSFRDACFNNPNNCKVCIQKWLSNITCYFGWRCLKSPEFLTYLLTYIFTFLLTKWRNVFIEKLNLYQLVKNITANYETLRFITSIKSSHHLSLSCFKSNQSMFHFQFQRCILILKSYLCLDLPNGLFP